MARNIRGKKKSFVKRKSPNKKDIVIGILSKHKKGFGFVTVLPDGLENIEDFLQDKEIEKEEIFIPTNGIRGAMNGDMVEVGLLPEFFSQSRREGVILKVLSHGVTEVVGTFKKSKHFGFVVAEDRKMHEDVFVNKKFFSGAKTGDKVVASIIRYPDKTSSAEGKITEIVAKNGEKGADIKALVRSKGYFFTFPSRAAAQAKAIAKKGVEVEPTDLAAQNRKDLRDKCIITIDGADSKDFDDAISVEILENGNYLLGVHIADVSHYVTEKSPLDLEALKRGTSIYLIDYVVPMLPAELSNDICSLRPGVDRLTLSIDMEIDKAGDVKNHQIYKSVIRSSERMVYDDVSDLIEGKSAIGEEYMAHLRKKYAHIYDDIMRMSELAKILEEKREKRGNIDFDIDEAYIKLDDEGQALDIGIAERRCANRLIEEFMLLANQTIAEHFYWLSAPFVYRVHEKPELSKIEEFNHFLQGFGISLKGNLENVHPKALSSILDEIRGTEYENIISTVMLRSMKKAIYGTECEGHFGLALKYYCHFTSPIRRYPDLIIHRIIKEYLEKVPSAERIEELKTFVCEAASISSTTERKAQELERDVEKLKKCEYMSFHIGEHYQGVVSGITAYGIYVELPNTIEGMIRLEYLMDDYYDYEPEKYRVIGRRTGNIYTLGQTLNIKVKSVDLENREINFTLDSKKMAQREI